MFPHLHSQIHFALPGFESGSFSITFNLPNVLPLKSMRVGEEVCRRQPHDFVPLVRSRFVEALTLAQPHRTAWFAVLNPFYNGQHIKCAVGKVYQLSHWNPPQEILIFPSRLEKDSFFFSFVASA